MNECIVTSSSGEDVISVWDSLTGTSLMCYRGSGVINPKGIDVLGTDYLVAVEKSKPLLRVWPINSQQSINSPRLLCPGKVSVMACSPDSCYIALAVEEKFYIYQVASGFLLGCGIRHFQPIVVIKWCNEGSMLACGGQDGIVTVWNVSRLLNKDHQHYTEPLYVFTDHTLPVTDLIITLTGSSCTRNKLISVSADRTCKMYEMTTGKLLISVVFTEMLSSVAISPNETEVFVGATNGDIYQFSLRSEKILNVQEVHLSLANKKDNLVIGHFIGHKKTVNCLSVSLVGDKLVSGSLDSTIKLWHIISKQCLKTIEFKGPLTNAFFVQMPIQMLENDIKWSINLKQFQKMSDGITLNEEYTLDVITNKNLDTQSEIANNISYGGSKLFITGIHEIADDEATLKNEINKLRKINEQLYKISVDKLLQKRSEVNNDEILKTSSSHFHLNQHSGNLNENLVNCKEDNIIGNSLNDMSENKIIGNSKKRKKKQKTYNVKQEEQVMFDENQKQPELVHKRKPKKMKVEEKFPLKTNELKMILKKKNKKTKKKK